MAKGDRVFSDIASVVRELKPSYPVYCVRPEVLVRNARRFIKLFPGDVLYAVKCNPHTRVLEALYEGGIRHFDTASLPEIAQICEAYEDAHSYFMHPVKTRAAIEMAYRVYGIRHYVVDHIDELQKLYEETEKGRNVIAVVRMTTPKAEGTLFHLAGKFGASEAESVALLKKAKKLGMEVGIAFHVGSQCMDPGAYTSSLEMVGRVIAEAGIVPQCVDVGGGFPARYANMEPPPLEQYIDAVREGLRRIKLPPTVEVFCEPGRALVATGVSLLVQVQLRKGDQLYINDGIYGSLQELTTSDMRPPARLVRLEGGTANEFQTYGMMGPTCDSVDVVPGAFHLPVDVKEGDWIEIDQIGAYSNAIATRFNGFYPETFVTVMDDPVAAQLSDGPGAPSVVAA
ncbi:type III PLP-dependent enzyme [Limibacillus sp. MBR-115]|uniref:type III PLP-dependent enzyme n=1 Tax=Limibacillus sp. MBR-115 TaxID=3156465 RepID=UPI003390A716